MSVTSLLRRLTPLILIGAVLLFHATGAIAESEALPKITLLVENTQVNAGDELAEIAVYIGNYTDTLAGFAVRLNIDRPGWIEFRTDIQDITVDTIFEYCDEWDQGTCIHWVDTMIIDTTIESGAVDTTGSAISGWEFVTATSSGPHRQDIKVTGLADKLGAPYHAGLAPSQEERLLFKLKVRAYADVPDEPDSSVEMLIVESLSETNFSNPYGDLIATITRHNICDTLAKLCTEWDGDSCVGIWVDTSIEMADSIVIDTFFHYWVCDSLEGPDCVKWVDTICTQFQGDSCINWIDVDSTIAERVTIDSIPWTVRDTAVSFYDNGTIQIQVGPPCICGDATDDGAVNVGDAVFLINFIFKGGAAPPYEDCANANGDSSLNIGDAVYLINYIFKGGAAPICQ